MVSRYEVVLLSTVADPATGDKIARALVEDRLAACVNLLPGATSFYRWEGEVNVDHEALLVIKTTRDATPAVRERLGELHSYELPELIQLDVSGGDPKYLEWLRDEVDPEEGGEAEEVPEEGEPVERRREREER